MAGYCRAKYRISAGTGIILILAQAVLTVVTQMVPFTDKIPRKLLTVHSSCIIFNFQSPHQEYTHEVEDFNLTSRK